ncbi:SPOR domain-containing protein [Halomonas sp. HG01]|uniref:SPOR domain-containing protein n=1 Tax=Halomonas sp. HG01 TaxID=1609967 RepID=UPI0006144C38|nr:SPOR domain-containing protein [Halomonas sp. HG01]
MKYGWRERISGALILLALAVIFLPLLFDDPAPREDRPQPTMSIEQPIEVPHREPEAPEPSEELSANAESPAQEGASGVDAMSSADDVVSVEAGQASVEASSSDSDDAPAVQDTTQQASTEVASASGDAESSEADAPASDPIADLARAADERMAASDAPTREAVSGGEWAVQVGSFGEPANAERLEARLEEQGFPAYRRPRNNDLTTVYVGPYARSEVAEQAMSELKADLNLQGLLVEAE